MTTKETILIVDDEKTNINFIVNNLQEYYELKVAPNGEIALKILEKFYIDLVLLDIQMPVLDGYETIIKMKQNKKLKDIPVIFLTAKTDSESLVYGFELGAKDYVTKPFNTKELQVRVQNHLQTSKLIRKLETSYKNLEKFIETQDNIVILTNGQEVTFGNKKFFEYFGYKNLEDYKKYHDCVCETFIENDKFFHIGKLDGNQTWTEALIELPHSQRIVSILGKDFKPHAFSVSVSKYDENTLIVGFADISQTILENIALKDQVVHDKLTNAYNREFFEANYKKLLSQYHNHESKLAIALLDIDHFKSVNDTYGHDVGDEVLIEFVNSIHKYSRKDDLLIRWGGEEFILILKVHSKDDLLKALEHLRKVIEIKKFSTIGQKTCSIGGTVYENGENIENTIKRSDDAVYEAKRTGRNKVVIF